MLALPVAPARADERSFVFSSIDFPGATFTRAFGINAGGEVVGTYIDGTGQHGFRWSGGIFTRIDFPGAAVTEARAISPGGDIVGAYQWARELGTINFHGYLLTRQGEFIPVDFPGHISTVPNRILADGTILGCYHDTDLMNTMHGMVARRDGFTEFDMGTTMHFGATPDGKKFVGVFFDMMAAPPRQRGYLLDGLDFIPFDGPAGSTVTQANDINPSGDIVGFYRAAGTFHGFLAEDGQFTTIDVQGATATRVFGINAGGDITGLYVDAYGTHGFVGSRTRGHNR